MSQLVTRPGRRVLHALGAFACAAALTTSLAATAQAKPRKPSRTTTMKITPSTPVARGSGYLALGDSVPFGYMEPTVVPAPDFSNAASFVGYPEILASELHLKLANAACPGETSASLINAKAQSNGCETSPDGGTAYRPSFPLHVKYSGSQLSYAVSYLKHHSGVRLVSLMVGANDFFLCEEQTADQCASPSEQAAVVTSVEKNVRTIIAAIRGRAHYRGQLVVVDYYSTSPALNTGTQELDHFINQGTSSFHVRIANAYNSFAFASVHSGDNACTAGLLTQLSTGGCGVHPSVAGQTLLASTLERAIRVG